MMNLGFIQLLLVTHSCAAQTGKLCMSFARAVKLYVQKGGNLHTKDGLGSGLFKYSKRCIQEVTR